MATGKVHHWKHGWIPVSPEAKAYVAGRGPKPGTKGPLFKNPSRSLRRVNKADPEAAPNAARGMPASKLGVANRLSEAQDRSSAINAVVPLGILKPHYSIPSQDKRGTFDGGVEVSPAQTDKLIGYLRDRGYSDAAIEALTRRDDGVDTEPWADLGNEAQARARGRELARMVKGIETWPSWDPKTNRYTGGVTLTPSGADVLIKDLEENDEGTEDVYNSRRMAGLPGTVPSRRFTR